MPQSDSPDADGLPAPGHRWGAGAQSVLPYLTRSLLAKPADSVDLGVAKAAEDTGEVGLPGAALQAQPGAR